jgi:hypothetical protein
LQIYVVRTLLENHWRNLRGETRQLAAPAASKSLFKYALAEAVKESHFNNEFGRAWTELDSKEKEVIMDNCLFCLARLRINVVVSYLLIVPAHRVIIGT